jgi:hypothetical protein
LSFVNDNPIKEIFSNNIFNGSLDLIYNFKDDNIIINEFLFGDGQSKFKSSAIIESVLQNKPIVKFNSKINNFFLKKIPKNFENQFPHLKLTDILFDELFVKSDIIIDRQVNENKFNSLFISGSINNSKIDSQQNLMNSFKSSVSGNFEAELDGNFEINNAKGSFKTFDFFYKDKAQEKPIYLQEASFKLEYQNKSLLLFDLKSLTNTKQEINGNINFYFNDFKEISQVKLKANSPKISYKWMYNNWPKNFAPKTKLWLEKIFLATMQKN